MENPTLRMPTTTDDGAPSLRRPNVNADGGWAFRFIVVVAFHDINFPSTRLRLRIRSCMFHTSTALSHNALCVSSRPRSVDRCGGSLRGTGRP